MDGALSPRWRNNATWLAAKPTYNQLRQLSDSRDNFWASFPAGEPDTIIGYPARRAEDLTSTLVSGSNEFVLLLGAFDPGYCVVDRIGTTIMFQNMVMGGNQRPTGQAGWWAHWRTGASVLTSSAFKLLKL